MKRSILTVLAVMTAMIIFTSCGAPAANNSAANKPANNANTAPANTANSEADVKKFIGDLAAALGKNDTAALDKFYADDYEFVSPEGEISTKAQRIESMKSGDLKMESITFDDVKVRLYGDTAVVTAKAVVKSTTKGKDTSGTSTATIIVNKTKDGWRVVLGHPSSPMASAKTEDKRDENEKSDDKKADAAPAANK